MASRHGGAAGSRTIKASEFKARCLRLMDEVAETGKEIVITKHGRPVSRLVPCPEEFEEIFGADREIIRIHGDIVEPPDIEWEAEIDPGRILDP